LAIESELIIWPLDEGADVACIFLAAALQRFVSDPNCRLSWNSPRTRWPSKVD